MELEHARPHVFFDHTVRLRAARRHALEGERGRVASWRGVRACVAAWGLWGEDASHYLASSSFQACTRSGTRTMPLKFLGSFAIRNLSGLAPLETSLEAPAMKPASISDALASASGVLRAFWRRRRRRRRKRGRVVVLQEIASFCCCCRRRLSRERRAHSYSPIHYKGKVHSKRENSKIRIFENSKQTRGVCGLELERDAAGVLVLCGCMEPPALKFNLERFWVYPRSRIHTGDAMSIPESILSPTTASSNALSERPKWRAA